MLHTRMGQHRGAAPARGGLQAGGRFAKVTAAWLLLLAAAGAARAQMTAAQMAQMDGLTPQERSLYLLKAAVNGDTVCIPDRLPLPVILMALRPAWPLRTALMARLKRLAYPACSG